MEKYAAFISYRHRQPDQSVAIHLHRMIEHYSVPKELRKEGEKRLGRVFRDEDELPLSKDLGESIHAALEGSEFLIAICTPEYQKSRWCMEELDSFIAMHGRDRVLAVLAEGTPEESFPPQLLYTTDENGEQKPTEPLAANITAQDPGQRLKRLKTEKLRLIASMIGCSFDTLYQRDRRYRQRRNLIAFSAVLTVALAFIGMLISKNAQIQEKYEEARQNLKRAQLSESRAMVENARIEMNQGKRSSALVSLLQAVPEDPEQPYERDAEAELADVLGVYQDKGMRFSSNIQQETGIECWVMDSQAERIFTGDSIGIVRCFSVRSGKELWQQRLGQRLETTKDLFQWCECGGGLFCATTSGRCMLLSAADGSVIWNIEQGKQAEQQVLFVDEAGQLLMLTEADGNVLELRTYDARTGSLLQSRVLEGKIPSYIGLSDFHITSDQEYAAVLMRDLAADPVVWEVLSVDLKSNEIKRTPLFEGVQLTNDAKLAITEDDRIIAAMVRTDSALMSVELGQVDPATGEMMYLLQEEDSVATTLIIAPELACTTEYAAVSCNSTLYLFSLKEGRFIRKTALPGMIMDIVHPVHRNNQGLFLCTFDNGLISFLIVDDEETVLTSDFGMYYFEAGMTLGNLQIDAENEVIIAAPLSKGNERLIIRDEGETPETVENSLYGCNATLSPSGNRIILQSSERMDVLDNETHRIIKSFDFDLFNDEFPYYSIHAKEPVFVSDEDSVILDKWLISLSDGKAAPLLPNPADMCVISSAWIPSMQKAGTAILVSDENAGSGNLSGKFRVLWDGKGEKDVELADHMSVKTGISENVLWHLGGSGLLAAGAEADSPQEGKKILVYDLTADEWAPLSGKIMISDSGKAVPGNDRKILAVLDGQKLSLYEAGSENPEWEMDTAFPSEAAAGLCFSPEDQLLLITYAGQRMAVYRTADGRLLNDISFRTNASSLPEMRTDENGRLYVWPSGTMPSEGLILDNSTAELMSRIPDMLCVNLKTNRIYRNNGAESNIAVYPVYSFDQLLEKAKKLMD